MSDKPDGPAYHLHMAAPTIHLSFDQDWAPAWTSLVLRDALAAAGVQATLFVTHPCSSLEHLREDGWELGWHPNYLPGSSHGSSLEEVLDTMASWVPEARGVRAHCLIRGTPYLQAYRELNLIYDASDLRDAETDLKPFVSWTGLVRLPIFFEDDVHLERNLPVRLSALRLSEPGLKVFTFHPVLVALNAADLDSYRALKADLAKRDIPLTHASHEDFAAHRQDACPGMADLLSELLAAHMGGSIRIGSPLHEVAKQALLS